jgi:mannose-6-phosphate isomerase-like protein (cupin superfamily)
MEWHTTGQREELLLVLAGRIRLELGDHPARRRRRVIRAGQCAWVGRHTPHRVLNESRASARYLYVTG